MKNPAVSIALFLLLTAGHPAPDGTPVAVYADLDGTWEGTFVGYDTEGQELYRIAVRQTYRTIDEETQTVEIEDTLADGTVVTGKGHNLARRARDGSLELRCIVEKSTGDRVDHSGRLGTGPGGETQLVWYSDSPGRLEVFREVVRKDGDGWVYTIDGVGRYGESLILMAGRYRKVSGSSGSAD